MKIAGVLIVVGLALCIGAVATQKIMENEREVSIGEVPEAVRATILAQAQGNAINEIEMEVKNGQTIYEAEVIIGGRTTDVKVAADGALLGTEVDDEEGDDDADEADVEEDEDEAEELVALAEVPGAVQATLVKEAAGAEIKEIEKEDENGRDVYSADVILNGQEVELKVARDGTLLGKEVDDEDE
ncbi:MAG: hypothetical protein A2Y77_03140 [Planctomycetes bacterium RBG_13_62_9]|nr:MAG: hypothetical protein A2Y77_03140 [Planctomycetes bacterium RBG_13_62_9]